MVHLNNAAEAQNEADSAGLKRTLLVGTSWAAQTKEAWGIAGSLSKPAAVDDSPWTMTEAGRTQKTAECGYCDSAAEVRRSSMGLEVAEAAGI